MRTRIFLAALLLAPCLALGQTRLPFESPRAHWSRTKLADYFAPQTVIFVDSSTGYVGGSFTKYNHSYYRLFRTSDGGATWREIDPAIDSARIIPRNYSVSTPTSKDIFLSTQDNLCSFDSGVSWIRRSYGRIDIFYDWKMFSASSGYSWFPPLWAVYKTYDSTKSWPSKLKDTVFDNHATNWGIYGPLWLDSLHCVCIIVDTLPGFSTVNTTDGGLHWAYHYQQMDSVFAGGVSLQVDGGSTGVSLVHSYNPGANRQNVRRYSYFRSSDLGVTWQANSAFAGRVAAMAAFGPWVCLALSNGDTLTKSHPASLLAMSQDGTNWQIDSASASGLKISAITFVDPSHGWAIGNDTISGNLFEDSTTGYILKYIGPPLMHVSTRALPSLPRVDLSPNPVSATLHFHVATDQPVTEVEVINVLGNTQECRLLSLTGSSGDVDVSGLSPGAYLLRLWTSAGYTFKSFVKLP